MLRFAIVFLLLIHGLIHLLGFVSQWHLATVSPMTGKPLIPLSAGLSRLTGLGWLLACVGFALASVAYWFRSDGWIALTLGCVILSQALIIVYWPDARAGTVANVLIVLVLGLSYAQWRFDERANQEAAGLLKDNRLNKKVITPSQLAGLPAPVQHWLTESGVIGKEMTHTVRLRQRGLMRTSPNGAWMPTQAEQYISVDQPGFVWKANVRMLSVLPLAGRDKYVNGKGNMLIKALSVVPVVDASDAKIDQGTLLRYLGEIGWFPSAALSPFIHWQPVDDQHARATMTYKGVSGSALFTFNEQYRLSHVAARRYKGSGEQAHLENWSIPIYAWKSVAGLTIPVKGDVIWKLPEGDFTYYRWEITDIDYNRPALY